MEKQLYYTYLASPVGFLKLTSNETALVSVNFCDSAGKKSATITAILEQTMKQLAEYFQGTRVQFNLKLAPEGTAFQQKVWEQVLKVPFGDTTSYLDIALQTGSSKNTRAVGLANGKNPIPIIIPCHRIIGSNGKLTGYAGGIERKRWLLHHELSNTTPKERLF